MVSEVHTNSYTGHRLQAREIAKSLTKEDSLADSIQEGFSVAWPQVIFKTG